MSSGGMIPLQHEIFKSTVMSFAHRVADRYLIALLIVAQSSAVAVTNEEALAVPPPGQLKTLYFEQNIGQADPDVRFLARKGLSSLFLTREEAVISQGSSTVPGAFRMRFAGAVRPDVQIRGVKQLRGKSNYFIGSDRAQWRPNVPHFGSIIYEDLYQGVDMLFYANEADALQYDFIVDVGADPSSIRLMFDGVEGIRIDRDGRLSINAPHGELVHEKPLIYQLRAGARERVDGGFVMLSPSEIGFSVPHYDRTRPLIIDPVVLVSSYFGGSLAESAVAVDTDPAGNIYVGGTTSSVDFPTKDQFVHSMTRRHADGYLAKFSPDGTLLYSSVFGGILGDGVMDIAVHTDGTAFATGTVQSPNFPVKNAYDSSMGGPTDAFVIKLSASGTDLEFSTFLGGSANDFANGIALDSHGAVHVVGQAASLNFPVAAPGPIFQSTKGATGIYDAFVTKFNVAGSALEVSTYIGGRGDDIAKAVTLDGSGNMIVVGSTNSADFPTLNALQPALAGGTDYFVSKLAAAGNVLLCSTYLGGRANDKPNDVTIDGVGKFYVTGVTASPDFPVNNALQPGFGGGTDAVLTKFNAAGSVSMFSTFLGGSGDEDARGVAVDQYGSLFVTGFTTSGNFPLFRELKAVPAAQEVFITSFTNDGRKHRFSTYFGGASGEVGQGITLGRKNRIVVVGTTGSSDFPTKSAHQPALGGGNDAFLLQLTEPGIYLR